MSEIAGLKTNTTSTASGNVKGIGAQMLGFQANTGQSGPIVDENGFQLSAAPEQGYWSRALFTGLENQPTIVPTMGFQAFRGSNTIIRGGTGRANNTFQRFNPMNWNRYSSQEIFRPELSKSATAGEKGIFKTIGDRMKGRDGETISDFWRRDKPGYSPFNLSDQVNSIGRKMLEGADGNWTGKVWKGADFKRAGVAEEFGGATIRSGSRGTETLKQAQESATKMTSWLEKKGVIARNQSGEVEKLFGRGTMSHMLASTRLTMGGASTIGETTAANLNNAVKTAKGLGSDAVVSTFDAGMSGREAGLRYGAETATGTIGSRIAGHGMGARFGEEALGKGGNEIFEGAARNAMTNLERGGISKVEGASMKQLMGGFKTAYTKGAEEAAARAAGKEAAGVAVKTVGREAAEVAGKAVVKEGAEMAGKALLKEGAMAAGKYGASMVAGFFAGPAGWIADVAMTAWMVYDMAKLGVNLAKEMVVKPVTNFVKEGFRSYKGQLDKAPMGMGFKDNSVAMTSRQRGVMAISNSRLNARSVLGNEAAGMAAHFG